MKNLIRLFRLAWYRLFAGDTPLFFRYWGSVLAVITAVMTYLNAKILLAPTEIQEEYTTKLFIADTIVGLLHVVTPFMATKNRAIAQDDFKAAITAAKLEKHKGDINYPNANAMK